MKTRFFDRIIVAEETSDGDGVRIKRSLGKTSSDRMDPFLMLDEFGSDRVTDYIGGFPDHPHRGFETITYMLEGSMLHSDHLGNRGQLSSGDVQWMTAGRGIIHSEMPQQTAGRMRGFQVWLNLPAAEKMREPEYVDIRAAAIPSIDIDGGCVKLIAGQMDWAGTTYTGPAPPRFTRPLCMDISLASGAVLELPLAGQFNAVLYVYEGTIGNLSSPTVAPITPGSAIILGDGESVGVKGGKSGGRLVLLAGCPLGEPIVQYGPFVMNTRDEIEQAVHDYQSGRLIS